jgi:site-specific recombinase XerD
MTCKDIPGHADIRTTEIYATVLAESRMKQIKKLDYGDAL